MTLCIQGQCSATPVHVPKSSTTLCGGPGAQGTVAQQTGGRLSPRSEQLCSFVHPVFPKMITITLFCFCFDTKMCSSNLPQCNESKQSLLYPVPESAKPSQSQLIPYQFVDSNLNALGNAQGLEKSYSLTLT